MSFTTKIKRHKMRRKLWDRQGGKCHWCKRPMIWSKRKDDARQSPELATFEHLKERALGGSNHFSNLALACYRCNNERGKALAKKLQWGREAVA